MPSTLGILGNLYHPVVDQPESLYVGTVGRDGKAITVRTRHPAFGRQDRPDAISRPNRIKAGSKIPDLGRARYFRSNLVVELEHNRFVM